MQLGSPGAARDGICRIDSSRSRLDAEYAYSNACRSRLPEFDGQRQRSWVWSLLSRARLGAGQLRHLLPVRDLNRLQASR